MGNGNFGVGKNSPTRKSGKSIVEPFDGNDSLPVRRVAPSNPQKKERPKICGAMTLQCGDNGRGNESAPQKFVHLVGCRETNARPEPWVRPRPAAAKQ